MTVNNNVSVPAFRPAVTESVLERAVSALNRLNIPSTIDNSTLPPRIGVAPSMVAQAKIELAKLHVNFDVVASNAFAAMGPAATASEPMHWANPGIGAVQPLPAEPMHWANPGIGAVQPLPVAARTSGNLAAAIEALGLAPQDRAFVAALLQYDGPVSQTQAGDAALLDALVPYAAKGKLQTAGIQFHEAPGGGFVVYSDSDKARAKALGVDVTVGSQFTM